MSIRKTIVFVFLIMSSTLLVHAGEKLDGIAAVVNDEIITHSDIEKQYSQVRKDMMRSGIELPTAKELKAQVLQHMIDVQLQIQEAKKYGIVVTDAALEAAIQNIAEQNQMGVSTFKKKLVEEGFEYNNYKKNIRQQMIMSEIQKKIISSRIKITPQQINNEYTYALKKQDAANEFHIKNILVPVSDAPSSREVVFAKQKAELIYMQLLKGASFDSMARAKSSDSTALEGGDLGWRTLNALPEVFLKAVKQLEVGGISKPISTPNGFHIIKLVEKRSAIKPHYKTMMHVRHILLRAPEAKYSEAVHKRIKALEKEIKKTGQFEKFARKYSEDISSGANGGDMGWVQAQDMVPEFAKAITELPLHKISQPIHTEYGWHLVQVLERKRVDDRMEQFKNKIAQQLYQKEFENRIKDWLQVLRSKSYISVKSA